MSFKEAFIKKLTYIFFLALIAVYVHKAYALEETYYQKQTLEIPYREQALIVGKEGFYPNRLVVFKGEKVRFFVTSAGVDSACFNIPDKNVFSTPVKDKITETEVFFDKVGVFHFNCPNNTFTGRIIVLEKASDRIETARRGLASDIVKVWRPKETPSEWDQKKPQESFGKEGEGEDYIDLDRDDKPAVGLGRSLAVEH